jgi:hypothetical protein
MDWVSDLSLPCVNAVEKDVVVLACLVREGVNMDLVIIL